MILFDDDGMIYIDDAAYRFLNKKNTYYIDIVDDDDIDYESIDDISDILDKMIEFFSKEGDKINEKENQTEQNHPLMGQESSSEQYNDEVISSDTKYHFNFPKISHCSVGSQVHKIIEEANEIQEAVDLYSGDSYSRMKILEETLDCIHACETFLNEIALSDDEINIMRDHILNKNMKRGYYNPISYRPEDMD